MAEEKQEDRSVISVVLPAELKAAYERIAEREDRSLASMVRIVLETNLPEWENKTTIIK